jgi:orotidine-5'-phosphate decarboxylase
MLKVSGSRNKILYYSRYHEFIAYFEDNITIIDLKIIDIVYTTEKTYNKLDTIDFWFSEKVLWTSRLCLL